MVISSVWPLISAAAAAVADSDDEDSHTTSSHGEYTDRQTHGQTDSMLDIQMYIHEN